MRTLFTFIIVGALGFLAFVAREELQKPARVNSAPIPAAYALEPARTEQAPPAPEPQPVIADAPTAEIVPPEAAMPPKEVAPPAPPAPRIRTAAPGEYFLATRVSVTTDSGVLAILPGESVRILYRNKDGTARVKWGSQELTVPQAQLTKEFDLTAKRPVPTAAALPSRPLAR